ncbi:MAG: rhomboid family protein [Desulfobacteraceae bacterium]|nr:rhomboid family protein [Desulfobacteraceae bacterium]
MDTAFSNHCYNHRSRQAVARCPECGNFYCRECVTEHDERMLCSNCLAKISPKRSAGSGNWLAYAVVFLQGCSGWLVLSYTFYLIARALLAIPDDFHEGTIWRQTWWNR